jgi:hypothetical protein
METFRIDLGGISFNLQGALPINLPDNESVYKGFIKSSNSQYSNPDVSIRIEPGNLPDIQNYNKIFSSGQSWSMYRNGDHFWLARDPKKYDKPLWIARFDKDFSDEVVVYCGDELIKKINGTVSVDNPFCYPLDQILAMYYLSVNGGVIFHAAGIAVSGKGYVFPGPSGAGKSTICRQFKGRRRVEILSDDRIIVRQGRNGFLIFGTPWPGEEGNALNLCIPLTQIFFLAQGASNRIVDMDRSLVLKKLLKVVSIPWYDKEVVSRILVFCENLLDGVPFAEFQFVPNLEVAAYLEELASSF